MISAARTVVSFGVLLQLTGFAKLLIIAKYFGAGALLDAYYLALVIPTFLLSVSSGLVQTAVVPAYVGARARGNTETARSLANASLTWIAIGLGGAAALLDAARGLAEPIVASGLGPETRVALGTAFVYLAWSAPLNALADAVALLLNAEGRFSVAAAAPLANLVVSTVILVLWGHPTIDALVWSLLVGLVVQTLMVLVATRATGMHLRPQLVFPSALPRLLSGVAAPALFSMVVGNLAPAFVQVVSARVGTGAISAMGYASRLHNSLVQAVVISVSLVLLPRFSRLIAESRNEELRTTLERLFAATLLFAAAAVVLVAAGGEPAIQMLLQRGNFTPADTGLVSRVWLALTAGLFSLTWYNFLFRLLQARQLAWVMLGLNCMLLITNVALALSLLRWGLVGVASSTATTYTLLMWWCHRRAARTLGPIVRRDLRTFAGRAVLLNLLAYCASIGWEKLIAGLGPFAVTAGQVGIVSLANIVVARTPPLNIRLRTLLTR